MPAWENFDLQIEATLRGQLGGNLGKIGRECEWARITRAPEEKEVPYHRQFKVLPNSAAIQRSKKPIHELPIPSTANLVDQRAAPPAEKAPPRRSKPRADTQGPPQAKSDARRRRSKGQPSQQSRAPWRSASHADTQGLTKTKNAARGRRFKSQPSLYTMRALSTS